MQQFAQTSQSWLWLQIARTRRGEVLSAEVTISDLVDTEVVESEAMWRAIGLVTANKHGIAQYNP